MKHMLRSLLFVLFITHIHSQTQHNGTDTNSIAHNTTGNTTNGTDPGSPSPAGGSGPAPTPGAGSQPTPSPAPVPSSDDMRPDHNASNHTPVIYPPCSNSTGDETCTLCIGPMCKIITADTRGFGWEILIFAILLSLIGLIGLCMYHLQIKRRLYHNIAWVSETGDDDDFALELPRTPSPYRDL